MACTACSKPNFSAKPPPIVLDVAGIDATPIKYAASPLAVDWRRIAALPPFQMFAAEHEPNASGVDSLAHAANVIRASGSGAELLTAYEEWHQAKGHWPNETPTGEVR